MLCMSKKEIRPPIFIKVTRVNDRLGTVIQNSPKTAISEHSKCQKCEDKDSQKTQSIIELDVHVRV